MAARMIEGDIDGPIAWTRASLAGGDGRVPLSEACVAELLGAVALLRANPLPVLALDPSDFDLPQCRQVMAGVQATLERGAGFAIVHRLPLERMERTEAVALFWLLSSLVARPVAQKWDGTMVYDVRDTGRPPGNGVRPDVTNAEQSFHTDNSYNLCPPEHVGLLCLHPAREGGVSRIVSLASVHNEMRRRRPDLLARLYQPFYFDRQREHAPGDLMVTHHPVFETDGGRLLGRLSRYQVRNGQTLAGAALDAQGEAALDELDRTMDHPDLRMDFHFEAGQMQFVNNRQIAHKRTGFRDWPEPERKRHLVRLWLRDRGRPFYNG
ncbi:MAG TPA: TauD/TfdA family dioxygenase [Candidatus Bathyarchaeia archaeon]|nr:TauD/TfdA family dioxygenase [Candidatus Bathyarchaeia archaeon]